MSAQHFLYYLLQTNLSEVCSIVIVSRKSSKLRISTWQFCYCLLHSRDVHVVQLSRMDVSCHVWMCHVTYGEVMSYIRGSCHIWGMYVTYEGVMSYIRGSCHIWKDISHMKESCQTWGGHVTSAESCHIWRGHVRYEEVMSHSRIRVLHMKESCHICKSHDFIPGMFMLSNCHVWRSHVTYEGVMSDMKGSCHI